MMWIVSSPIGLFRYIPIQLQANITLEHLSRFHVDMTGQMSGHVTPVVTPLVRSLSWRENTAYFRFFQNFHRLSVRPFVPFFVRPCPPVSAGSVLSVRAGFAIGNNRES